MCQPTLTHYEPAGTPTTQQPRKTANHRHITTSTHPSQPAMCQPPLAHSKQPTPPEHQQPRKTATRMASFSARQLTHPQMCQPPLAHSARTDTPTTQQPHKNSQSMAHQQQQAPPAPANVPATARTLRPRPPSAPLCASHHWHIAPQATSLPTPTPHTTAPHPTESRRPLAAMHL